VEDPVQTRPAGAGLGLALLSAATFSTSGSFASSLISAGWTPGAAVTVRVVLAALALTLPAALLLRGRWQVLGRSSGTLAVYGVAAVAGAQLCYFMAVQHLSVAVALLLEYSGALLVVLWVWLTQGQRPGRLTVAGAGASAAGLALVLDVLGSTELDPVGVLWGLGAAVGLAAYFVVPAPTRSSRRSSSRGPGWPSAASSWSAPDWRACCPWPPPGPTCCSSTPGSAGWCRCSAWRWSPPSSRTSPASSPPACSGRGSRPSSG
jgi:drug/metabolite transporter (DMT)-like permease